MELLTIKDLDTAARLISKNEPSNDGGSFILITGAKDESEQGVHTSAVIRGMGGDIVLLLGTLLDDEEMRALLAIAIESRKWNEDE